MVNTKMTTIADKIRSLLGITGKMGLDAMATNLETEKANIESAFSAVGSKGGTIPESKTSGNLASAIETIFTGVSVQMKSGTVTGVNGYSKTVDCGFKPDVVLFIGRHPYDNSAFHAGVDFHNSEQTNINTMFAPPNLSFIFTAIYVTQTSSGFQIRAIKLDNSMNESDESNRSIDYIAIKYT